MVKVFKSLDDPELSRLLNDGAVGVIPTDTVYGLVARAADRKAVERLYRLKHRVHKPGTVIAANIEQLMDLGIDHNYLKSDKQYWPGPVSVEIPHNIDYLNQGTGRQAFRIPVGQQLQTLLRSTGPLQTTSANPPDESPANTMEEARLCFGDMVDFYVDGGDLSANLASTIIRVNGNVVEVIRQGPVRLSRE